MPPTRTSSRSTRSDKPYTGSAGPMRSTRSSGDKLVTKESAEVEKAAVRAEIKRLDLVRQPVASDGNCFFRAVSDQLWGHQDLHLELRQWVCDWIVNNKEEMQIWVEMDPLGLSFDGYIARMRKNKVYAQQLEVTAMARLLRCNIRIVGPSHTLVVEHSPSDAIQHYASEEGNSATHKPFSRDILPATVPGSTAVWVAHYTDIQHYESIRIPGVAGPAYVPDTKICPHGADMSEWAKNVRAAQAGSNVDDETTSTTGTEDDTSIGSNASFTVDEVDDMMDVPAPAPVKPKVVKIARARNTTTYRDSTGGSSTSSSTAASRSASSASSTTTTEAGSPIPSTASDSSKSSGANKPTAKSTVDQLYERSSGKAKTPKTSVSAAKPYDRASSIVSSSGRSASSDSTSNKERREREREAEWKQERREERERERRREEKRGRQRGAEKKEKAEKAAKEAHQRQRAIVVSSDEEGDCATAPTATRSSNRDANTSNAVVARRETLDKLKAVRETKAKALEERRRSWGSASEAGSEGSSVVFLGAC